VTFEVDANAILQVSAADKGTGKTEKITITAEKGRLSPEEIERMVKEAEENAEADAEIKGKVDARNSLESYSYNLKNQLEDEEKGLAARPLRSRRKRSMRLSRRRWNGWRETRRPALRTTRPSSRSWRAS